MIIRVIKSRWLKWAGHVAHIGEMKNKAYETLVEKAEGKRLLWAPRLRFEDNIKIGLKEIRFVDVDWIHPARGSGWGPVAVFF
jgi:hypothetical protein